MGNNSWDADIGPFIDEKERITLNQFVNHASELAQIRIKRYLFHNLKEVKTIRVVFTCDASQPMLGMVMNIQAESKEGKVQSTIVLMKSSILTRYKKQSIHTKELLAIYFSFRIYTYFKEVFQRFAEANKIKLLEPHILSDSAVSIYLI